MNGSFWVDVVLLQRAAWDSIAVLLIILTAQVRAILRDKRIALKAQRDFRRGGPRDDAMGFVFGLFYLVVGLVVFITLLGLLGTTAAVPAPDSPTLWRSLVFGGILLGGEGLALWGLSFVLGKLRRFQ